eukprot:3748352-Rhodomonas_salina.1
MLPAVTLVKVADVRYMPPPVPSVALFMRNVHPAVSVTVAVSTIIPPPDGAIQRHVRHGPDTTSHDGGDVAGEHEVCAQGPRAGGIRPHAASAAAGRVVGHERGRCQRQCAAERGDGASVGTSHVRRERRRVHRDHRGTVRCISKNSATVRGSRHVLVEAALVHHDGAGVKADSASRRRRRVHRECGASTVERARHDPVHTATGHARRRILQEDAACAVSHGGPVHSHASSHLRCVDGEVAAGRQGHVRVSPHATARAVSSVVNEKQVVRPAPDSTRNPHGAAAGTSVVGSEGVGSQRQGAAEAGDAASVGLRSVRGEGRRVHPHHARVDREDRSAVRARGRVLVEGASPDVDGAPVDIRRSSGFLRRVHRENRAGAVERTGRHTVNAAALTHHSLVGHEGASDSVGHGGGRHGETSARHSSSVAGEVADGPREGNVGGSVNAASRARCVVHHEREVFRQRPGGAGIRPHRSSLAGAGVVHLERRRRQRQDAADRCDRSAVELAFVRSEARAGVGQQTRREENGPCVRGLRGVAGEHVAGGGHVAAVEANRSSRRRSDVRCELRRS